jgi:hypothetical protein
MSSVVISGDTSGAITLSAPAVAGTNTITLPAVTGTAVVTGTTPTLNGITFPATQVSSADANTLDDYEEGTWTPIDGSGAGLSFTVSNTPRYTKIGNLVTVNFFLSYPANANGTGNNIGGLPFTIKSNTFAIASIFTNANLVLNIYYDSSSSFSMRTPTNTTPTNATLSTAFVSATLTYQAA